MTPSEKNKFGRIDLEVTAFAFGTAPVGNIFREIDDEISRAMFERSWEAGVRYFEPFDDDPKINKEAAGNDLSNLRKLQYGRLDAVISTESQADYLIATQSLQDEFDKAVYRYDYDLPVYFALSRRSAYAQYGAQFSEVISELADRGVFEDLIAEYMRNPTGR